jgi:U32 family peptidase
MSELLSPAGSLKAMRYAFAYGADAVYAGQPRYSLRVRNNEFSHENLVKGIKEAHAQGKKFFVASNVLAHDDKVKTYLRDLKPVVAAGPDALIVADPGLIMMIRETWPEMDVHLSVQANVTNSAQVKFWQKMGLTRIILSRELSLKEIAKIRDACPDIELEVFVHGALCMAYSGRCLLSGYFNHRDSNQGACTNACRWKYRVHAGKEDASGNVVPDSPVDDAAKETSAFLVEDVTRPGKFMPIEEDEQGTQIFNSKDLRAIQHIDALIKMGIDCLKIEGRTKSFFYAARITQLYRQAIDDANAGKPFDLGLMDALEGFSTRGYTEGFYRRHVPSEYQRYEEKTPDQASQQFIGEIVSYDPDKKQAQVCVKNHFEVGDDLEIMLPSGNQRMILSSMQNEKGHAMPIAPGSGYTVSIPLTCEPEAARFGLVIKHKA